jgi:BirA family transcriptional regulator, biotin operon repressor / biotin---[acetyl-CoA-carboxylase] ligase
VEGAREAIAGGFVHLAKGETASTNDDALTALREGRQAPFWVTARMQKAGRGRHGRVWTSPPGNMYATLALVEPCEQRHAAQFGYLIGLALHDAIAAIAPAHAARVRLKWPNDVLVDGAKIAGMLLEGHHARDGRFALIAGIGANIAFTPDDTPYPAARLADLVADVTPEALFDALARAFARRFAGWREAPDATLVLPALREDWLARAHGLDGNVTIRLPGGPREGRFVGLDADGRLLLMTAGGIEAIDAGDLYFAGM